MIIRKGINFEVIQKNKEKLLRLAELSKQDIKKMFFQKGDEDIEDLDNMEYRWNLPLYCKHIFRFVNGDSQIGGMYWGLDGYGQMTVRRFFKLNDVMDEGMEIMDFICWMKNSLGSYNIVCLEKDFSPSKDLEKTIQKSELVKSWKRNCITFFFELNEENQMKLISDYNAMNLE